MVQINSFQLLAFAAGAFAATIPVEVAQSFSPTSLTAQVGDIIQFNFNGMHSVVQSEYSSPCSSSSTTAINSPEMSSGAFSVMINSTDPIWLYCGFGNHCQNGMVMVINPPASGDNLDAYTQASVATTGTTIPAEIQGGIVGEASAFSGGSSTTSSAASSGTASSTGSSSSTSASGSAASASPSNAAEKVKAFGVAGVAGLLAAVLA